MKCTTCGYDDLGTGDSAHVCGTAAFVRGAPQYIGVAPTLEAERAALIAAVRKLVKAKGRYHTEQNYMALVAALDAHDVAAASTAAPVAEGVALPPLPQPMQVTFERPHGLQQMPYYTAEQVRQAQREAYELGKRATKETA